MTAALAAAAQGWFLLAMGQRSRLRLNGSFPCRNGGAQDSAAKLQLVLTLCQELGVATRWGPSSTALLQHHVRPPRPWLVP